MPTAERRRGRVSSFEVKCANLLPSEAKGKNLCIDERPEELDLIRGMSLCLEEVTHCQELVAEDCL